MAGDTVATLADVIAGETARWLESDPKTLIMGAGAADAKGVFGTTLPAQKVAPERVMEIPISETMLTGALVGLAMNGWSGMLIHQRMDFATLSVEHLVNTAAKFKFMGVEMRGFMVRCIIGQGWGNGPQHTQSFAHWFASVPGIEVCIPVTGRAVQKAFSDVRAGKIVVMADHRRLHGFEHRADGQSAPFADTIFTVGAAYMDGLAAKFMLQQQGVTVNVVPVEHVASDFYFASAGLTNAVIVDCSPGAFALSAELAAQCAENGVKAVRVSPPPFPVPVSRPLEAAWYPSPTRIANAMLAMLGKPLIAEQPSQAHQLPGAF